MSEQSTPEERTEMPTERRVGQLRREGAIFVSMDTVSTATMLAGFLVFAVVAGRLTHGLRSVFVREFNLIGAAEPLTYAVVERECVAVLMAVAPDVFLITFAVAVTAVLAVMLQTNWNIREKKFKFDWAMLNPMAGIKRVFSMFGFMNVLKSLVKLALILPVAYFTLKRIAPEMLGLVHLNLDAVFSFTGMALASVFWKIFYILLALAIFDYLWGYFQWLKNNKMTKAEVKDERKSIEGDEETKRRMQMKGLQRIMQRIQQSVPKADVVVTNPTHYAVALKYERGKMAAPQVVAKGADFLAKRIKEIARESGVPVLERKLLARALYQSTEVGSQIPHDLFKAVAEVLAYVYRLKNPYAYQQRQQESRQEPQ